MSTTEIKERLHQVIDQIEDINLLNEIDEFISDTITVEETPLNEEQRKRLDMAISQGLKDIEEGRTTSWEDVKKKHPQWFSK